MGSGYGNLLEGKRYHNEYKKVSNFLNKHKDEKILFLELGAGRLNPMLIQELFWNLTLKKPNAFYISVNDKYDYIPKQIENQGFVIKEYISKVLEDIEI